MSLPNPVPLVIGSLLKVALDGATLSDAGDVIKAVGDAGTYTVAGKTARPSDDDTAWVSLGRVQDVEVSKDGGEEIEIWDASTGKLQLDEIIRVGRKLVLKAVVRDVSRLALQVLLQSSAIASNATSIAVLASPHEVRGWVKLAGATHKGVAAVTLDLWCDIDVSDALKLDPKATADVTFTFTVLNSPVNAGGLPDPA